MKRFAAEISLGLATAAAITVVWSWAHGQPATLLQNMVLWIGLVNFSRLARGGAGRPDAQARQPVRRDKDAWPAKPDEEMLSLLRQEQVIPAIKRHRELHGGSLRDAVDYVHAVRRDLIAR